VVLPNPAGAEIRDSLRPDRKASFNCSINLGLETSSGRDGGIYSLVASSCSTFYFGLCAFANAGK
jgi:hypothetical protein